MTKNEIICATVTLCEDEKGRRDEGEGEGEDEGRRTGFELLTDLFKYSNILTKAALFSEN